MSAPKSVAGETNARSPLEEFTGEIQPTRVSPLYTVGLAVVAFAMVLLPAIYIALILLVAAVVIFHLLHNTWIMTGSDGAIAKAIIYFGPAVVGGILVFFMLKPLFARKPKIENIVSLDPAKELLLFAFVQRICQLVHAPMPSRIDVDCQVNASARLRRGVLSKDLVLTIGLPLAAGLDMRQFAGVLAHEFGHFAQGAAMRLTYIIRNINFWFARVVYERDKYDVSLDNSARRSDFRIAIILHAARGCIWLTRRILWSLMQAGHAISCFMLRQMEYDADSYEAKVAGSDSFTSTFDRIRVLNIATQVAFQDVRQSWASNRLPENLPLLINHKAGALPEDVLEKLTADSSSKKTKWSDTHPCDTDRTRATLVLNEPGVFRLERPASELFADFSATSKAVTRHQYQKHWSLEFTEGNLVSSNEMLRESTSSAQSNAAVKNYFGEVNVSLIPLLTAASTPPLLNVDAATAQYGETRALCEALKPEAQEASVRCVSHQQAYMRSMTAFHLAAAGFKIQPKEFGLSENATTVANQKFAANFSMQEALNGIQEETAKLEGFIAALRLRLTLMLQLVRNASAKMPETSQELETLVPLLVAVGSIMPKLQLLGSRFRPFTTLAQNRGNHANPGIVDAQMSQLVQEMNQLLAEIQLPLGDLPYPFPHPRGKLTIKEYARYEKPEANQWAAIYHQSTTHVERLFALRFRLLGRFLSLAETAEKELGLTPKS